MATFVKMPAVIADADSAFLASWLKQVGDTVKTGDPLAEIETEKATVEMAADAEGTVARILVPSGCSVEVGTPIAVLALAHDNEAAIEALLADSGVVPSDAPAEAPVLVPADAQAQFDGRRIFSSPLARRRARELDVDLANLVGTGPSGRILREDVETASRKTPEVVFETPAAAPVAPAAEHSGLPNGAERIELTRMRQAIARRLTESKTTVPHFYLTVDVRMDDLVALRKQANTSAPRNITVNDLVVRAIGLALTEVPEANAVWAGDSIIRHAHADIAVAIATETGLLTPIVRNVDITSITGISATIEDYARRAKIGKIRPDELTGGTFTVSNLGMFGTKEFSAILNPPQAGILAVGAAEARPVVLDGELAIATQMTCTLSADHRVIDGAVAARLLAAFKERIENPLSILL
ncbi:dihydrolipoamide acetyltransferase family protein [Paeniglutamicibacter sp. NPDC012692]|uniref:dihydrolipoamide acetyltransferase family protein n=1 Tax=Paeniglutamicibacter sp. NPDC012692 TaxID=3364388 RepID=UPI0036AF338F